MEGIRKLSSTTEREGDTRCRPADDGRSWRGCLTKVNALRLLIQVSLYSDSFARKLSLQRQIRRYFQVSRSWRER
jgi:hypothetical protein